MKKKQIKYEEKGDETEKKVKDVEKVVENEIKSLFCYGDPDVKKLIWSLKTNKDFYISEDGENLIKTLAKEIGATTPTGAPLIIVCAPSSSFWQNKKSFDHMHVFIKRFTKSPNKDSNKDSDKMTIKNIYIPHAIIPRLNKNLQKSLNKKARQEQSLGAYTLSNYFKFFLKINLQKDSLPLSGGVLQKILIIDDVKTTGSTLSECSNTLQNYIDKLKVNTGTTVSIECLAIAYEA